MINWTNPTDKISKYFTVGEALLLPSWNVMHIPSDKEKDMIVEFATQHMDLVRDFVGLPIRVHCWLRPVLNHPGHPMHGHDYNAAIGGAPMSAHKEGIACDFHVQGTVCDDTRKMMLPKLDEFKLRMEDLPGSNWVHLDARATTYNRFFKP